jgi:ABC-type transport system involved in multi-copper enzyme maturation permease subunit
MSANSTAAAATTVEQELAPKTTGWSLWVRQSLAILKLELRKNFFGRRAILIYLLALLPVGVTAMLAIVTRTFPEVNSIRTDFSQASIIFGGIYGGLILRTIIFFGCAWIFMNLIRGEVVDRSLHYYFLSPVRREVLVVAKYLAGLLASIVIFTFTTLGALFFMYVAGYPDSTNYLTNGPGLNHALWYVLITVLACIGYGAFFIVIGLFFRNPIIPALVIYGWEWINFLLPPLLKKVSVIHYLHSLAPVPLPEGPFAIVAEPTPAWISVPGLIIMTAILLFIAGLRIRRMEIKYIGE